MVENSNVYYIHIHYIMTSNRNSLKLHTQMLHFILVKHVWQINIESGKEIRYGL